MDDFHDDVSFPRGGPAYLDLGFQGTKWAPTVHGWQGEPGEACGPPGPGVGSDTASIWLREYVVARHLRDVSWHLLGHWSHGFLPASPAATARHDLLSEQCTLESYLFNTKAQTKYTAKNFYMTFMLQFTRKNKMMGTFTFLN